MTPNSIARGFPVITGSEFKFPGQTGLYHGKVRDVYAFKNDLLAMVATDRISAFDVILPRGIPFKGMILNSIAVMFLKMASDFIPVWLLDSPDPNVSIGLKCEPLKVEMVIRGYLCGHAWRVYQSGQREICGVKMPEGLRENDPFPGPIITPSTKASVGHDEDISKDEIIQAGLVLPQHYDILESYTRQLFQLGTRAAAEKGLILCDTKYEFGLHNGKVMLMDEIHTPDSSRYFYADGFERRQSKGEKQKQLSKEFVREWLMENGFMGGPGQTVPEMSDSVLENISGRYIELYEKLSGKKFEVPEPIDFTGRIEANIRSWLASNTGFSS